ncbi:NAD-dependent epimerase/dehydratase family protein [Paraglaciecola hydrolytica]|uniref:NAD-dependent epimerase/dehydratase domain-containing protein n=1 Tax=Paraglaciecola hydrolytica TaxID=1799789 RepID=A0A135ZZA0_9ALTE|nr:NAD-dependent epimerase/dehydratase family protein [Paraglaciecola hydrolytica]KXI28313.1 hypothetical protein AX660_18260 [Paraglaciecola hydrolytica]
MDSHSPYKSACVLVTGASGFIGLHLCQRLLKLGARVVGIYLSQKPLVIGIEWIQLDVTELGAVKALIDNLQPTYIFHLASTVDGRRELKAVQATFENNLLSTINVLSATQQLGSCKKLVLTHSQEEPERGDSNGVPCSPYAAAKYAASAYARMFHALYNLPVVIARIFMVYGPGQRDLNKLVPYTILQALNQRSPQISSGQRKIDWIYVSDVVEGLLRLGCSTELDGQTIDLGSGQFYTVADVVTKILKQIAPDLKPSIGALPERKLEQQRLAKVSETAQKLNWQSQVSLDEGLNQTIAWYQTQQYKS